MECDICKGEIGVEPGTGWIYGHNAHPVVKGRCCADCNYNVVLPARLGAGPFDLLDLGEGPTITPEIESDVSKPER